MDRSSYSKNANIAFIKSMENKSTKNLLCANCSQIFSVRDPLHPRGLRCPLILHCGHSACENCVRLSVQNFRKVVCGTCKRTSIAEHPNAADVREDFPLNLYLLGVFAALHWSREPEDSKVAFTPAGSSLGSRRTSVSSVGKEHVTESCSECGEHESECLCQQCRAAFCGQCFTKVHQFAKVLSKHKRLPLRNGSHIVLCSPMCETHPEQKLEFYCSDCNKMLCSHCIICFHQGHNITTKRQKNEELIPKLDEAREKATEVLKRLFHTQKKLNDILTVPGRRYNISPVEQEIINHFVYLHGALQILEGNTMQRLKEARSENARNLDSVLEVVNTNIQEVKKLIQESIAAKDVTNLDKIVVEEITNKLKEVQNVPCHLIVSEQVASENPIRFVVDESFVEQIEKHCGLQVEDTSVYKLVKEDELPPDAVIEPIDEPDAIISASSRASSVSALSDAFVAEQVLTFQSETVAKNVAIKNRKNAGELVKGSSDIVIVSHVRDPSNFYIHRVADLATLENLSVQLTKLANTYTNPPDTVMTSGLYIVQYRMDNKWYRARVRDIRTSFETAEGEDMVDVLYIDYGNTESVPVSKLRCIPPKFAQTPPLAFYCGLFGISPIVGKWTQDAIKTLVMMVNGHRVKMMIMDHESDKYQVDLCQNPGDAMESDVPVSVRDALVFLEHACFMDERRLGTPIMSKIANYFQENIDVQKGNLFDVLISQVDSPHSFYVQKLGEHAKFLSQIMKEMNTEYYNSAKKGLIYRPEIGMPCAARYSVDKRWYRAKVVDLPGKKMVEVFYVDYGNQEVLPWNELRKLNSRFLKIAAQAIHCSLNDITPKQGKEWTPAATKFLLSVTTGKILKLFVDEVQRLQLRVTLYYSIEEMDICINGLLVREGHAISIGCSSAIVEFPRVANVPSPPPVSRKSLPTKSLRKKVVKTKRSISNSGDSESNSSPEKFKQIITEDPFRLEVKILNCASPNCIYVSLLSQEEQIKNMMCELQQFYATAKSGNEKWEVGNKCCAFSVKHKQWFRAIILELLPNDEAKVFLKDFAEIETVPIINLQLLDPVFLQIRDGATKCHLAGVKAAGDRAEWPTLACEYLTELIEKYPHIYITKKGEIENWSLPVELWVKNTIPGGPLEPTKEEWVTLNSKLSEQGLAIPIKGESEAESIPSVQVLKELNEQGLKDSNNTVSEWLQLSAQADESAKTESSSVAPEEAEQLSDAEAVEEEVVSLPSARTDWDPPPLCTKRAFKATPTYVDDEGFVYLHDTEQSGDVLKVLGNALYSRFNNSQPKPHDQYWFRNQLCIVQYHSDKKWYRGKVISVNEEDRTIKVLFVDYGNVEDCKASELRKNICMEQLPVQCQKCQLYGIKPATEDGKWTTQVLDFLHTTIVEKPCYVKLVEEPKIGEPLQISLTVCSGNLDIAELLTSMQFAIESDSTSLSEIETLDEDESVIIENEVQTDENEPVEEVSEKAATVVKEERETGSDKTTNCEESVQRDTVSTISDDNLAWIDLIDMEEGKKDIKNKLRYRKLELPICDSIPVEVTAILSSNEVVIHPLKTEDSEIFKVKEEFDKMAEELQENARTQPVIKKPYIGQPCCACYTEDGQWYRGMIMAIDEREQRLKIQYVDYGNVEYLPMDKTHKLKAEWTEVPVLGIRCVLWNIERPAESDPKTLYPRLIECMFQPPLIARIKTSQPVLSVELFGADGSTLIYQPLLDQGLLLKKEEPTL